MKAPVPMGFSARPPGASTASRGTITGDSESTTLRWNFGSAMDSSNLTVYLSTTWIALTSAARVEYCALSFSSSYEYFTSSAVISRPLTGGRLWNFTPWRSLKIHVEGLTISQLVASVLRIVGVRWTSGKYQVTSHSVSVSQTRASSGR